MLQRWDSRGAPMLLLTSLVMKSALIVWPPRSSAHWARMHPPRSHPRPWPILPTHGTLDLDLPPGRLRLGVGTQRKGPGDGTAAKRTTGAISPRLRLAKPAKRRLLGRARTWSRVEGSGEFQHNQAIPPADMHGTASLPCHQCQPSSHSNIPTHQTLEQAVPRQTQSPLTAAAAAAAAQTRRTQGAAGPCRNRRPAAAAPAARTQTRQKPLAGPPHQRLPLQAPRPAAAQKQSHPQQASQHQRPGQKPARQRPGSRPERQTQSRLRARRMLG